MMKLLRERFQSAITTSPLDSAYRLIDERLEEGTAPFRQVVDDRRLGVWPQQPVLF